MQDSFPLCYLPRRALVQALPSRAFLQTPQQQLFFPTRDSKILTHVPDPERKTCYKALVLAKIPESCTIAATLFFTNPVMGRYWSVIFCLRRRERIELASLAGRRGTFVVELVGGGKTSRALLRKGRLLLSERISAAGHAMTILHEDGTPVTDGRCGNGFL